MGSFVFIAIFIGLLTLAGLYLWIRQRENADSVGLDEMMRRYASDEENGNAAMIVTSEHGSLVHINAVARRWLNLNGVQPDLEDIANLAQPSDNFLDLLGGASHASFQLGSRWVEASSHYVPVPEGARIVVVMNEMKHVQGDEAQEANVMDVSTTMGIINEIGETVNAGMGVELALQVLLEILNKAIPSDAGEICIWDDAANYLVQRGWIGDTRYLLAIASQGGGYQPGDGVAGWMAQNHKPIVIGNPGQQVNSQRIMQNNPYASVVGVPIWLGEDFVGTLAMFSESRNHYNTDDLSLLLAVSKSVGQAIRNAELYARQEDRIRDIASLQQITEQPKGDGDTAPIYDLLTERMAKLLDADMCGVLIYDDTREALIPQLPFHGLPSHVADKIIIPLPKGSAQRDIWVNQPYWVSNDVRDEPLVEVLNFEFIVEAAGIENTALFPMQIAGERIGVMAISNKHTEGGFMPNDIQNLRVLSSQAAIVVENVRLYQRERRIDTELVGLQEMTHAIGALSHEGEFFHEISERIARLMETQMCGVLLYEPGRRALVGQLPFYGIDSEIVRDYVIPLPDNSVMLQLWNEEDSWLTNQAQNNTLVFTAGLDDLAVRAGVFKTLVAVMAAGGRRIGVVQVSNKISGEDFDEKDARLLQIFATQAGAIIENARLYREVQLRANQADRLRRIAEQSSTMISTQESFSPVLEEIAQLAESEIVYINVVDYNTNTLVAHPRWVYGFDLPEPVIYDLTQPGFEHVPARSGRPFITNDSLNDERVLEPYRRVAEKYGMFNTLIVPLMVGDRLIGELGVANRESSSYEVEDLATFGTVAAQIASSIERLLLFEATGENLRRRVEELDAIARVSNELTITRELDKILDVIRDEAAKATYADSSTIVLLRPMEDWRVPDVPEMDKRVGQTEDFMQIADIEREAVARGSEPFIVPDYRDTDLTPMPENSRSAAAAAVLYLDQIVGVIHIYDRRANAFDDRAAGFLMTLAAKASLAYQSHMLYQQQRERGERLRQRVDQLNRIFELGQMVQTNTDPVFVLEAIAYSVQQSVGFDTVLMLLIDEETGVLRRVAHAGMPLDAFMKSQQEFLTKEQVTDLLKADFRTSESYFFPVERLEEWYTDAIPIVSAAFSNNRTIEGRGPSWWHDGDMLMISIVGQGGNLLGLMSLDRPYDNKRPERGTIEVLEIFAHQASSMIENTRLFRESQRSAAQEARLNDTMESIAGTRSLRSITELLANGLRDLVSFDRLTLVLLDDENNAFDMIRSTFDEADQAILSQSTLTSLDGTAMGRTFDEHEAFVYSTGDAEAQQYDDLRSLHQQGEQNTIMLALNAAGTTLGVMHLGSNRAGTYDEETRQLLIRAAQLVASTVQNARLFNQAVNLQVLNRSVVESIQQGIVVLDEVGHIISINQFMRTTYGWDDDAREQFLFDYRPDFQDHLREPLEYVLSEGVPRDLIGQTTGMDTADRIVRNFYLYPLQYDNQVNGAVLLVEDVTERTQLEEAIEARANQLAALTEVSTRITASLERDEVIDLAMDEMGWIIPFDMMTMWRRNGSYMVLEGISGEHDAQVVSPGLRVLSSNFPPITQLVESQRVVAVTDETVPHYGIGDDDMQSWMGVPLVNQGHVVGMFSLARRDNSSYTSRQEHNVAFAFASQVAIALANAELFEQTFERTNELGTLLEAARTTSLTRDLNEVFAAVADLMFSAIETDDCTIMIYNQVDNELEVQFSSNRLNDALTLPSGTTYSVDDYPARAEALQKREVIVIIDVDDPSREAPYPYELDEMRAAGIGARMVVPLVVSDQARGIIQLDQTSNDEDTVTQQKVRLARALGAQVAVAIENARLTSETNLRFEELLTINQLSQSISSTLNLDDMLPIIREQVPQVTRAEELYLALYDAENEMITFPLAVRSDGTEFHIPSRPLGNDEVSYIIRRKHTISLDDNYFSIHELRRSMKIDNGEGDIKSYMGVPLRSGEDVLGVLAIRNVTFKRSFNIDDDRILTTVGSQLGAAIQNARLFTRVQESADYLERTVQERTDELEEERDRLDKLYQITSELARTLDMEQLLERSLGMVSKAVGAHDGVIMLSDPATDTLFSRAWLNPHHIIHIEEDDIRTHPAAGLAEWLIHYDTEGDNVVLVGDLNEKDYWDETGRATGLRSALAVMLENNEDPMGVMVLLSEEIDAFTENHLKLLVPAATQVAASINSADLYHLIRDQAERMGKLLRSEQEEAQKHSAILEAIADGVMLADNTGTITLFNSAAERILDLPRGQALGQPVSQLAGIYGSAGVKWIELINEWSATDEDLPGSDESVTERLQLGAKIIQAMLSPVYIGDLFLGTVSVFRDITRDVEADQAKSKFIENVSHEFRTPLTPIKGYTDLLLMTGADKLDEMQTKMIRTIKENTDKLAALVDDVLRVSKLDSGEDKMHMSLIDLHDLVPQVVSQHASYPSVEEKDINVSVTVEDNVPKIRGDRDKMVQIVANIVDNAFNYTGQDGKVAVAVHRTEDQRSVQLEITDTGVGIPEEFHDAVWQRFVRHDPTALALDIAGTGLGLSLTQELVRLHHGDIWFESEVGVGTTFFVRLPIEQPHFRTSTAEIPAVDVDETESIAGD